MSDARAEFAAVLRAAADALRAGATPAQFAELLYVPEVVVVGEGWPAAIRGLPQFMPSLTELLEGWGPLPDLHFTVHEPVLASAASATTIADVSVAPPRAGAASERYRIVYGWCRTTRGWRVALEMFQTGSF